MTAVDARPGLGFLCGQIGSYLNLIFSTKVGYHILSGCHGNGMPLIHTMNSGVRRTNGQCQENHEAYSERFC